MIKRLLLTMLVLALTLPASAEITSESEIRAQAVKVFTKKADTMIPPKDATEAQVLVACLLILTDRINTGTNYKGPALDTDAGKQELASNVFAKVKAMKQAGLLENLTVYQALDIGLLMSGYTRFYGKVYTFAAGRAHQ